ncbi:glycosyltransferase family 4 protein [Thalassotalea aquiviva]|uniref:glycosyltransferase family 4 protein n=1 Tax=Thalassotalea aquiviva TaxID=3242415 RepID=UPI00352AAC2C
MKLLCLTRYESNGASSRLRFYQYLSTNTFSKYDITVSPFSTNKYLANLYSGKKLDKLDLLKSYFRRFKILFTARRYDVIWIEKELLPFFPPFAERALKKLNIKFIVDYDDAVFHNYDMSENALVKLLLKNKIASVMKYASCCVVGNDYIYKKAIDSGCDNVVKIPTVIDTGEYLKRTDKVEFGSKPIIGWMGTPSTQKYIVHIKDQLNSVCSSLDCKLVLVGATKEIIKHFPNIDVQVVAWHKAKEVEIIRGFTVGIMPLEDGIWERGKCGYKLIQYLGCGIPCVASDVGVNREIITNTKGGIVVEGERGWEIALKKLLQNQELQKEINSECIHLVEKHYSLNTTKIKIAEIIDEI